MDGFDSFRSPFPGRHQPIRASRLDAGNARHSLNPAQGGEVAQPLPHASHNVAVAYRDQDAVGRIPAQLLADFERDSLFALDGVRVIARVAAVPTVLPRRFQAQVKRLVIRSLDQVDLRAEHQELGDLGGGRRFRHKDDRPQTHRGRHTGQCCRRVARTGRGDGVVAPFQGLEDCHRAGAVLEGTGRVASVVLDPDLTHTERLGHPRRGVQRRPAHIRQRRCYPPQWPSPPARRRSFRHRQQRSVPPHGDIEVRA